MVVVGGTGEVDRRLAIALGIFGALCGLVALGALIFVVVLRQTTAPAAKDRPAVGSSMADPSRVHRPGVRWSAGDVDVTRSQPGAPAPRYVDPLWRLQRLNAAAKPRFHPIR